MKKILLALLTCLYFINLPAMAQKTILIVGDSISAAYGIDINQGWVNLLKQHLQNEQSSYQVINASISGDTTSNGLTRISSALQEYHPQITIIELGGNDGLRALDLSVIKNNLQQMVILAKKAGSKVLILGIRIPPNYGPQYTQQFQQIFSDVAKQNAVHVLPNFLIGIDENPMMFQADRFHPNAQAQQTIMNNVWHALNPMLK